MNHSGEGKLSKEKIFGAKAGCVIDLRITIHLRSPDRFYFMLFQMHTSCSV
jgi:hypothetical protein